MPSCKLIYCSNKTGNNPGKISYFQVHYTKTERKNISNGYNINRVLER